VALIPRLPTAGRSRGIVDGDRRVAGLISQTDLLAALSGACAPAPPRREGAWRG
jgi:CBS-domain-containing membrane protein